ncbi:glycerate kinase [Exiguobacterium sp. TDN 0502]|uniref:glycerate kinase n=1 Tax=Exiguobacterium sp. TDN 0502 TaxID=3420731 RepID=UPI003D78081E
MGRHLILMDTFKGSISSKEAAEAVAAGILAGDPAAIIDSSPVADGGEGTLDVYVSLGYQLQTAWTIDLAGRSCEVEYAQRGQEAIIEVARICGLLMRQATDDPVRLHTRGIGRLVTQLQAQGMTRIRFALGGTGTTDGGLGLLAELDCLLQDAFAQPIAFQTNPLIETAQLSCRIYPLELEALVDVTAPYFGPDGPAHLFGPQKELRPEEIVLLDHHLERIGRLLHLEGVSGAGAAGGLGGAIHAIGGTIVSGAETILTELQVKERIEKAGYVWTGEGRVDRQSSIGKLPGEVVRLAQAAGVPCLVLAGLVEDPIPGALDCRSIHAGRTITLDRDQTYLRLKEQAQKWTAELLPKEG